MENPYEKPLWKTPMEKINFQFLSDKLLKGTVGNQIWHSLLKLKLKRRFSNPILYLGNIYMLLH